MAFLIRKANHDVRRCKPTLSGPQLVPGCGPQLVSSSARGIFMRWRQPIDRKFDCGEERSMQRHLRNDTAEAAIETTAALPAQNRRDALSEASVVEGERQYFHAVVEVVDNDARALAH